MAEPIAFDLVFDEAGNPQVPAEAAARLRARLGREPRPGEKVPVVLASPASSDAIEHWLRTDVVASYDDMTTHPERGLSADAVREHFAAKLDAAR